MTDKCDNCNWLVSNPKKTDEGFYLCEECYEEYKRDKEEGKPTREKGDKVTKPFVE